MNVILICLKMISTLIFSIITEEKLENKILQIIYDLVKLEIAKLISTMFNLILILSNILIFNF